MDSDDDLSILLPTIMNTLGYGTIHKLLLTAGQKVPCFSSLHVLRGVLLRHLFGSPRGWQRSSRLGLPERLVIGAYTS